MSSSAGKLKDSASAQVKSWLAKLYDEDASKYETIDDLLDADWANYPIGLSAAYYIADRLPVRQNIWELTPASKLTKLIKYAWLERNETDSPFHILIADSTLSGADSLMLLRITVDGDKSDWGESIDWWLKTKDGKFPNIITGGGTLKYNKELHPVSVEALQLTSATYDFS